MFQRWTVSSSPFHTCKHGVKLILLSSWTTVMNELSGLYFFAKTKMFSLRKSANFDGKGYLWPLKPLLELHAELLWCVGSGPHYICSRMHTLQWKIALLIHWIHHRVKGGLMALHATKTSLHCWSLPLVGLIINWRLLINHYCRFLAMKQLLLGLQSLSL